MRICLPSAWGGPVSTFLQSPVRCVSASACLCLLISSRASPIAVASTCGVSSACVRLCVGGCLPLPAFACRHPPLFASACRGGVSLILPATPSPVGRAPPPPASVCLRLTSSRASPTAFAFTCSVSSVCLRLREGLLSPPACVCLHPPLPVPWAVCHLLRSPAFI
jgi:hypothetical protein